MMTDVQDPQYREEGSKWVSTMHKVFWKLGRPKILLEPKKTALFIVDMQNAFCLPDSRVPQTLKEASPKDFDYTMNRMRSVVIPNLQRLQAFFRSNDMEVVYCHSASCTEDGRDGLSVSKTRAFHLAPNSKEAQIIDELKPKQDEIIFSKTTSGMFTRYSHVYHVLRSMGIEYLVFGGCCTDLCVESTVRGASDLFGRANILVEDCCATFNEDLHVSAIRIMGASNAVITSTEYVINHLKDQLKAAQAIPIKAGEN